MPILTIKSAINSSLPAGNQIAISILIGALEQIVDDYYLELGDKVDVVAGWGLSQENFSLALLNKLNSLVAGYLGIFTDQAALEAAYPTGTIGQYATVATTDTIWTWDGDTVAWINTSTTSTGDMLKSVFDPTAVLDDAFDMANMAEAANALVMTAAERNLLDLKTQYFTGGAALATIVVSTAVILDNANFVVMVEGQEWFNSAKIAGGNITVVYATGVITPLFDWEGSKIKVTFNS